MTCALRVVRSYTFILVSLHRIRCARYERASSRERARERARIQKPPPTPPPGFSPIPSPPRVTTPPSGAPTHTPRRNARKHFTPIISRAYAPIRTSRARPYARESRAAKDRIASHRIPSHRIASRRTHHETTLTNRTGLHGDGVRRTRISGFEGFDFVLGIGHCFVKSRREVVARCGGRARNFPLGWNYRS